MRHHLLKSVEGISVALPNPPAISRKSQAAADASTAAILADSNGHKDTTLGTSKRGEIRSRGGRQMIPKLWKVAVFARNENVLIRQHKEQEP